MFKQINKSTFENALLAGLVPGAVGTVDFSEFVG
jgi:hypothetical protein